VRAAPLPPLVTAFRTRRNCSVSIADIRVSWARRSTPSGEAGPSVPSAPKPSWSDLSGTL